MRKIKKIVNNIIVLIKFYYFKLCCKLIKTKEDDIWLISERGEEARDNSYHFFKYIRKNHPEINIKYVISNDSPDYNKVSCYGKTICFGSKEHYINMIRSSVLISTHPLGFTPDKSLFLRLQKMGLYNPKSIVVHLKHGITKDGINFDGLKFDLIVAGAKPEYDFMIKTFKGLEKSIEYTGFARFDALEDKGKSKKILIMPTFRKWLYYSNDDDFKKSSFFMNYQKLLNDKSLIDLLEKNGYEIIFYPHYRFQERLKLFETSSDRIKLASFSKYDVQELLIDCDLLVTDYSSVFFDFAYMNKPIIYLMIVALHRNTASE